MGNLKISVRAGDSSPKLLVYITGEKSHLFSEGHCPLPAELARFLARVKEGHSDSELVIPPSGTGKSEAILFCSTKPVKHLPQSEKLKTLASRAIEIARKRGAETVGFALDGPAGDSAARAIAEGCLLGSYRFDKYKSGNDKSSVEPETILIVAKKSVPKIKAIVAHAELICNSVNFCRDLINEPPAELYPQVLAEKASALASRNQLACEVLNEAALEQTGCNGILAVGKGSVHGPRLMIVRYAPKTASAMHLVIVGKAVTFDTGGYSLKPSKDMWEMKGDMSGGAAALSAIEAIARLKLKIRVTAIVPSVENRIDNNAYLPGDIIRAKNGKTVHVDNTDAEGRLILMDALVRAKEEGATHIVDLATLTGSVVRALGTSISGIFGTDQRLVDEIVSSGREVGEDFWQLPLYDEYREMLNSDIADMDNSGRSPNAGAIVAALFLREFVDPAVKWAHLDIAGTFIVTKRWKYFAPGATGVGVRTLVHLAEKLSSKASGVGRGKK